MSGTIGAPACDLASLRTQRRELTTVREDLARDVDQPKGSLLPVIGGAVVVGGIGAFIGSTMRTFGGAHGGPLTNIGCGLILGGAAGALIGTFIAQSMKGHVDPATANPDIGILDARIGALDQRIIDCAVVGS